MGHAARDNVGQRLFDAINRHPSADEKRAELEAKRLEQTVLVHAQQLLAERDMPDDLKQFAIEARMYNWALMVWQSGYSAGMRAVISKREDRTGD